MSIPFIWAFSNQRCEEEDLLKKSETDLTQRRFPAIASQWRDDFA
jgi:hypothetical protein